MVRVMRIPEVRIIMQERVALAKIRMQITHGLGL